MRSFHTTVLLGVAIACIGSAGPANAFVYLGGNEVYAALGADVPSENQEKQASSADRNDNAPQSAVSKGHLHLIREDQPKDFSVIIPKDMKIIGMWIGNLSYKIGQSGGTLYLIDPHGNVSQMAAGTNSVDVCVPTDNAFVKNIMRFQPVPSQESQLRCAEDKNGGTAKYIGGGSGLLVPTVVATRTMVVNGKPMIVGGPVICELPRRIAPAHAAPAMIPPAMPNAVARSHTRARLLPKKQSKTKAKGRKVREAGR